MEIEALRRENQQLRENQAQIHAHYAREKECLRKQHVAEQEQLRKQYIAECDARVAKAKLEAKQEELSQAEKLRLGFEKLRKKLSMMDDLNKDYNKLLEKLELSNLNGRYKTAAILEDCRVEIAEALAEEQRVAQMMVDRLKVELKEYIDDSHNDNVLAGKLGGMGM